MEEQVYKQMRNRLPREEAKEILISKQFFAPFVGKLHVKESIACLLSH